MAVQKAGKSAADEMGYQSNWFARIRWRLHRSVNFTTVAALQSDDCFRRSDAHFTGRVSGKRRFVFSAEKWIREEKQKQGRFL